MKKDIDKYRVVKVTVGESVTFEIQTYDVMDKVYYSIHKDFRSLDSAIIYLESIEKLDNKTIEVVYPL